LSFDILHSPVWADGNHGPEMYSCPAVSLFGATTPNEFYDAMQGESVENGLLNRFLVLTTAMRPADTTPRSRPGRISPKLTAALSALYQWKFGLEGLLHINDPEAIFEPDTIGWANDQARERYEEFTVLVDRHMDDHPWAGPYLVRCAEIAVRLATIRAVGHWGPDALVSLDDIQWGIDLAWTTGTRLLEKVQDFLPRNERSELTAKILGYIRRRNPVKPRDIQQFMRGRLRTPEIKDILRQLHEAGEIEWTDQGYQPTVC
jgi:hypothetical protein